MPVVCAEWLRADSTSGKALAESLSGLPGVAGEKVSVKDKETDAGLRYTITFPKSLGENDEKGYKYFYCAPVLKHSTVFLLCML